MGILNKQDDGQFSEASQREALQRIKLDALQQVLGNNGNYRYLDLNKLIDPNNKNWADYTYRLPGFMGAERQGHIGLDTPEGIFINNIRNAGTVSDVYRQSNLWDLYDPLSSHDSARKYFRYVVPLTQALDRLKELNDNPTLDTPAPDQPPQYGGPLVRRQKLQEAIENSNDSNPWLGGNYGSRRPGWGLVDENPQPQAPVKSAGKSRKVRQGRSGGNLSRSGGNTYASAGTPKGGVVSPATMMRTSGVQPVQAAYGNNAPMGEGFDYTRTYDPMSNSMRPNDSYSYYDPSRNAPSGGDGTDLTLTYDPMTGQMVRR